MTAAYGRTTRTLHWLTVAALATQFVVGYTMEADDSGRGRGRGRGSGSGRGRGRGGDDLEVFGNDQLLTVHVLLGVTILVLATVRLLWRRHSTLPPWAPGLSASERTLAHWTERAALRPAVRHPLNGSVAGARVRRRAGGPRRRPHRLLRRRDCAHRPGAEAPVHRPRPACCDECSDIWARSSLAESRRLPQSGTSSPPIAADHLPQSAVTPSPSPGRSWRRR